MRLLINKLLNSLWISIRRLGERRVTLILSLIIGVLSGFAAVVLKNTVHITHAFLQESLPKESANYLFLALPAVGILLTILFIKFFVKDNIGHGVSRILYSISRQNSRKRTAVRAFYHIRIPCDNIYLRPAMKSQYPNRNF